MKTRPSPEERNELGNSSSSTFSKKPKFKILDERIRGSNFQAIRKSLNVFSQREENVEPKNEGISLHFFSACKSYSYIIVTS